jgi:hypothetical protein
MRVEGWAGRGGEMPRLALGFFSLFHLLTTHSLTSYIMKTPTAFSLSSESGTEERPDSAGQGGC